MYSNAVFRCLFYVGRFLCDSGGRGERFLGRCGTMGDGDGGAFSALCGIGLLSWAVCDRFAAVDLGECHVGLVSLDIERHADPYDLGCGLGE